MKKVNKLNAYTASLADVTKNAQVNSTLSPRHYKEIVVGSAISEAVALLNFVSVDGEEFENLILSRALEMQADASGSFMKVGARRLRERHAGSLEHGGWYCAGEEIGELLQYADSFGPLAGLGDKEWEAVVNGIASLPGSDWGCFKSDAPRQSRYKKDRDGRWTEIEDGKTIKYEHPAKTVTKAFLLSVPGAPKIWLEVLANVDMPIIVTEGAKKAACLVSMGYIAIGLPGVAQWNKPGTRELIAEIAAFARKGREFYIAFDQDSKTKTRANVSYEICKMASALRKAGAKTYVCQWSTADGKGVDDLVVANGREAFDLAFELAQQFEWWALQYLSRMTYDISYEVPGGQKYIDGAHGSNEPKIPFPSDAKLIGLVAPKGTGKTEAIRRMIGLAMQQGRRVLLLTHRIQLTQALCDRTGIPSIYDITRGHADASQGYGLCVQSLHADSQAQFDATAWDDALVVIDECEQVLWEVFNSSTCKSKRTPIIRNLETLIANALSPATKGALCIADADLSNVSLDYIREVAGDDAPQPWIVRSQYKGDNNYECTVFEKNEQLSLTADELIDAGERVLIITDSQRARSRFGSIGIEKRYCRLYPEKKILRIDSDSLKEADSPAFGAMARLNQMVAGYDIVICSPSVETGVSIDLRGHFGAVVGFFQGVLSENSVRQSLARLREAVPRFIALPSRGLSFIGDQSISADSLVRSSKKYTAQVIKEISLTVDVETDAAPHALKAWGRFAARQNAGLSTYRDIVAEGLKAEGHTIASVEKPIKNTPDAEELKEYGQMLTDERHAVLLGEAVEVCDADDLTDSTVARMENANSVDSREQSLQLKKASLKRRYQGHEITPDLYILDQYGYDKKIRLHYALTKGSKYVKRDDRTKIAELLKTSGDGAVWGNDILRSTLSLKVGMLNALKIPQLLERDEISHNDRAVRKLAKIAYANRAHIKAVLGFSVSEKELEKPVTIAKKFLQKLGYDTGKAVQRRTGGSVERFYPVERVDYKKLGGFIDGEFDREAYSYSCDREVIFKAWTAKNEAEKVTEKTESFFKASETAQATAAQEIQDEKGCHNLGNRSYIHSQTVTPESCSQESNLDSPTPQPAPETISAVAASVEKAVAVVKTAAKKLAEPAKRDWNADAWAIHPATRFAV